MNITEYGSHLKKSNQERHDYLVNEIIRNGMGDELYEILLIRSSPDKAFSMRCEKFIESPVLNTKLVKGD